MYIYMYLSIKYRKGLNCKFVCRCLNNLSKLFLYQNFKVNLTRPGKSGNNSHVIVLI